MTDHGEGAGVDGSGLAAPDLVHGGAHIVVNPPARHAAQHAERMIMSVEQHLMGLTKIGPHGEGPAVAELEVCHLQPGAHRKDASRGAKEWGRTLWSRCAPLPAKQTRIF